MTKLYQKQNPSLSGMGIIQPEKRETHLSMIANAGAKALDKIAKDNFAMGHAALEDDIVKTAYDMNPYNPDGFMEMVKQNIAKQTKNLPGDFRRTIELNATKQAKTKLVAIKNNLVKKQNAELETNTLALRDNIAEETSNLHDLLFDSIINQNEQDTAIVRAGLQRQKERLAALSEVRTSTGAYVIGKESERATMKAGQYGLDDAFRRAVGRMSKDELKSFYENQFANQEDYMNALGIDFKTYDGQDRIIKNRIKEFDSSYKRQLKDQQVFRASQMARDLSDDEITELEQSGNFKPETIKLIKQAQKGLKKAGAKDEAGFKFGVQDQNEGFLAAMTEMQEVMNSVDDGSDDYADRLLQAGARANIAIAKMEHAGLKEPAADILRRGLADAMSSQDYSEILSVKDDSLLSEITRGARAQYDTKVADMEQRIRAKYGDNPNPIQERLMVEELRALPERNPDQILVRGREPKIRDAIQKNLNKMAAEIFMNSIAYASAGDYDTARKIREMGNKELIKYKYQDYITPQDFKRMETELANGQKPTFTYNNSVYEFLGFSQNSVIVKGRF